MKLPLSAIILIGALSLAYTAGAAGSVGSPFYGDPPDDHHPWAIHDAHRPQPPIITPGTPSTKDQPGQPPSDAIVLFDGQDLSKWQADDGKPTKWIVSKGAMECVPRSGYISTKESFGDCQLHVEWAAPTKVEGESQGRGNSGVFLMGLVEVQVLDNYNNPTYPDGAAGSVYSVSPPFVNALRPPGEFQVYDIVFRRPIYRDGQVIDPGYVTVFMNGVLVQDHTALEGETGHMRRSRPAPFPDKGPLKLQDHGNPVRYRNIWYRPLPPRAVEGGTDGYLSTQATMLKRKEIANKLRSEAKRQGENSNSMGSLLKSAESLGYDADPATIQEVQNLSAKYVAGLKQLPPEQMDAKKDEAKHLRDALGYLARFNIIPASFPPKAELDQIAKEHRWDKR